MKKSLLVFGIILLAFESSFAQLRPINERREVERVEKKEQGSEKKFFKRILNTESKENQDLDLVEITSTDVEFKMGEMSQTISAKRTVRPYSMNRYETTYRLWYKVRIWAERNGYTFSNPGQEGNDGRRGASPSKKESGQPVTNINWYDVIVWCNAFSEMDGKNPCYTYKGNVIRDGTDFAACDLAKCDWNQNGYRLPSEAEWEYAARKTPGKLQSDFLASGQIDANGNDDENVMVTTLGWISDNSNETHPVGKALANGAGLFDMCGNVLEFCWDWEAGYDAVQPDGNNAGPEYGSERVLRGGSFNQYTMFYGAGDRYSFNPYESYNYFGFRIAVSLE